jgi:hypothetical protein
MTRTHRRHLHPAHLPSVPQPLHPHPTDTPINPTPTNPITLLLPTSLSEPRADTSAPGGCGLASPVVVSAG